MAAEFRAARAEAAAGELVGPPIAFSGEVSTGSRQENASRLTSSGIPAMPL